MIADFQQYYNLDFDEYTLEKPEKAIILINQLPNNSRVMLAENPQLQWNTAEYFLRSMEYQIKILAWQNTKDGQSKSPKHMPKHVEAPWEVPQKEKIEQYSLTNEEVQKETGKSLKEMLSMPVKPMAEESKVFDDTMFDK